MCRPAGHLYVYLSYGMHFCCNVVCSKDGYGSGVLIEPLNRFRELKRCALRESGKTRKHPLRDYDLTNGPGKVCAALSIDRTLYGHNLRKTPCAFCQPSSRRRTHHCNATYWYQQNANALRFSIEGTLCIKVVPLASSTP